MRNPIDFWTNAQNRRTFLDEFAKQLKITSPKEWGKVTKEQLIKFGGSGLLAKQKGSVFHLLQYVYPGKNTEI